MNTSTRCESNKETDPLSSVFWFPWELGPHFQWSTALAPNLDCYFGLEAHDGDPLLNDDSYDTLVLHTERLSHGAQLLH